MEIIDKFEIVAENEIRVLDVFWYQRAMVFLGNYSGFILLRYIPPAL
jgi:hypothetical protein